MKSNIKKSLYPLILMAILLLTMPAYAKSEKIDKTFSVNKGGTLVVECDQGSIYVGTYEGDEVFVSVKKRASNQDQLENFGVQIEQRGNDIYVKGENGQDNMVGVEFTVDVPREYNVDLRTGEGYISVADIKGNVDAYTSEGNIKVSDVGGDLKAGAPKGSIRSGKITGKSSVKNSD
jgi:hypothetical protein